MTEGQQPVGGHSFVPNPEQLAVIEAAPHEWLLVVAGPGTGKTQVAAMRLVHLLQSGLQPAQILVLSFSRSAVATLSTRLASLHVSDRGLVEELRHLAIRTFDSWAFRVLRQSGEPVVALMSRSYEQNIAAVTRMLDDPLNPIADRLANIRHVIVDEFQDLPGVRATMVASLLHRLNEEGNRRVGFTVLGDPVQAIYRFAARTGDQPLADDPWQDLKKRVGPNLRELSLTENHRATAKLAAAAASLRKILGASELDAGQKLAAMQRFLANMPVSTTDAKLGPAWLSELPVGSLAILTRTNGEALRVWKMLLGDALGGPAVAVALQLAGAKSMVPPWIAGVLSGFRHQTISRKVFDVVYAKAKVQLREEEGPNDVPPLEVAWRRLAHASGAPESTVTLDLDELRNRLAWPDSFPDDQGDKQALVYITTVHQAKGMEFENVALLDAQDKAVADAPEDPLEQAHVGFVAVTRAGRHIGRLPNTCTFKPLSGRQFRNGRSRLIEWGAWIGSARWIQMQMGLEQDMEPTSFVSAEVHGDEQCVTSLQQALVGGVAGLRNRKVVLSQVRGEDAPSRARDIRYEVRLQEQGGGDSWLLGRTSAQVTQDLLDLLWEPGYAIPRNIYNLRIADVVTVAINGDLPESIPQPWRSSRIWLGITLAGTGDFKTWKRHAK